MLYKKYTSSFRVLTGKKYIDKGNCVDVNAAPFDIIVIQMYRQNVCLLVMMKIAICLRVGGLMPPQYEVVAVW